MRHKLASTLLSHLILGGARALQADKALWSTFEAVLEGMPLPFSRTNASIAKLELIGVVKERQGNCAVRNRIYRQAMQIHQTSELRLQRANLSTLGQQLLAATDLESLLHLVAIHLQRALQNRAVVIFVQGSNDAGFNAAANVGIADKILGKVRFEPGCRLLDLLEMGFDPQDWSLPDGERERLQDLKCSFIFPIRLRAAPIGFFSLGRKFSGEAYGAQELEFLAAVADQTAAAIDRFRLRALQQDAERARDIQTRLLPREIPQIPGFQISGTWHPARLVSGDYYDVLKFPDRKVGLCIGDVVGKGIPAALLMSNLQAAVRAFASETITPNQLCDRLNRLLASNIEPGKFITFFYAFVDAQSYRLLYTNAGHNPPILLRRSGEVQRLEEGGALLGVFPDGTYQHTQVELTPGDRLVLFTDGVSEAQNASQDDFGEERLIGVLTKNRGLSALELQKAVIQAVTEFSSVDFHDDVTLLIMAVL